MQKYTLVHFKVLRKKCFFLCKIAISIIPFLRLKASIFVCTKVYFSILCQMMDWKGGSFFCHDHSVRFAERSIRKEDLWAAI